MDVLLDAILNVQSYFSWPGPMFLVIGLFIGTLFGLLPGLAGPQAMVLLLPLTIGLNLTEALILLISTQAATYFAGSLTSILIGIPGTAVNAATILDGYPLTKQGKSGYAIGASGCASAMGGVMGALVLLLLIPLAPTVILAFSYQEFALLGLLGITLISLLGGDRIKGIIAGCTGLLMGTIGFDPLFSLTRFTFGSTYLWDGIGVIPCAIGLFGISEAIHLFSQKKSLAGTEIVGNISGMWRGILSVFRHFSVFMKGTIIGVFIGIIPGIGAAVAQFIAYASAKSGAKDQSNFGKGDIRGVIAPEASNNAKEGGSLVPTLFFGIPGSVDTAVMLSVFMIHGVSPGLKMLVDTPEIPASIIMTLAAANVFAVLFGFMVAPQLIKLTRISGTALSAPIIAFAILGAYAAQGSYGDVVVTFFFGILGYYMDKLGFSRVCLIIGLLLGKIVERNFRQSLMVSGLSSFFTRPIALSFFILMLLAIFWPLIKKWVGKVGKSASDENATEKENAKKLLIEKASLNFFFLFLGLYIFIASFTYQFKSAVFPFSLAVLTVVLVIVNILRQWRWIKVVQDAGLAATGSDQEKYRTDFIRVFLWLLGFIAALKFFFYVPVICIFILLSTRINARQSWTHAIVLSGSIGAFIYIVFEILLMTNL